MTIFNLPQFVNWRELPNPIPGGKPRKVPHDASTGFPIDHTDPTRWLTYEAAAATGWPVAFVCSATDPYFFFDLDGCREPTTGTWKPEVTAIAAQFPGAAMEVSVSGTGLHIVGRCNTLVLGPRVNKWGPGNSLEFYTERRLMCLGHGFQGDFDLDWTNVLAGLVPVDDSEDAIVTFTDRADDAWNGPGDDDEIIKLMLAARGSTAVAFGERASFADLWNADPVALAKHFPSPSGDAFDHSSADLALMNSLAFFTGRNTARMDRLFRRSGLMREKYDKRASIRHSVVSRAVSGTRNVYTRPKQDVVATDGTSKPAVEHTSEFIALGELPQYFAGCVYVSDDHAVMVPGGKLLKPDRFKAVYGGHQFAMAYGGEKPTMNAFEAFTENRAMKFAKVTRTTFRPDLEPGAIVRDAVNVYFPENIATTDGDVTPLLELLRLQLPNAHDRDVLLAWYAALVQNPGKKFLWSPVLQGTKGNGKSLWNVCATYAVGEKYSWTIKPGKIANDFNAYLRNRMFINVEEMHMFADKYEVMDTIKSLITDTTQEVTKKGVDSDLIRDYCANWAFCTNPRDSLIKERDDRRFAPFFTAQQSRDDMKRDGMLTDNYFPQLWAWLRSEGFAAWRGYLLRHSIPDELNPATFCTMAPETSSTGASIEASYGVAEQYILQAVADEMPGFRNGWMSAWAVDHLLRERGVKRPPRKIAELIESLGYSSPERLSVSIMQEGNARVTVYRQAGVMGDYRVAQGYIADNVVQFRG